MSCKKCNSTKCTCSTNICINPLVYAIKSVFSLVGTDSDNDQVLAILSGITKDGSPGSLPVPFDLNLSEALVEVLNNGISISNNKNLCCPDCKNGIYFLGGAENFKTLHLSLLNSTIRICCLEHASTIETWLKVLEETENQYKCCDTDFNEVVQQWFNASSSTSVNFYLDDILTIGVLESSSFNGYSGLGILFNYLQLNHPELTAEDYLNILGVIVNLGIVIQCDGCEMIIASVETYLKWTEATGGGVLPA